ncbi:MAG: hypothetical protein GXO93_06275 [FCB group bacterium]|nr:hypothetical protein [FCB group bacterium]
MEGEINLFELGSILLRKKRIIAYIVGSVVLLTILILLLMPNKYQSSASILPTGETNKLSSLTSLAGLSNIVPVNENSSDLFPTILHSKRIKKAVLDKTYSFTLDKKQISLKLSDYFHKRDKDKLYKALDAVTSISKDKNTGVINIAVETKYPALSQAIVDTYLEQLEDFNLHKRRTRAKENERYLAQQLEVKNNELNQAEDNLERFQKANRNWAISDNPEIIKALTNLQRDVEVKTKTLVFLTQQYEMAKFEAQKDVPIVQVLDKPSLPTQKSGPFRTVILLLTAITALMITIFFVILFENIKKKSLAKNDEEYQVFRNNLSTAFPRLNRLVIHRKIKESSQL